MTEKSRRRVARPRLHGLASRQEASRQAGLQRRRVVYVGSRRSSIVALFCGLLLAGQANAEPESESVLLHISPDSVSPAVTQYVAQYGMPVLASVDLDTRIEDISQEVCGRVDGLYIQLLRMEGVDRALRTAQNRLGVGEQTTIEMPACLYLPPVTAAHTLTSGENLESLYQQDPAGFSDFGNPRQPLTSSAATSGPNGIERALDYVTAVARLNDLDALDQLRDGQTILLPTTNRSWTTLRLRPSTVTAAQFIGTLTSFLETKGGSEAELHGNPEEFQHYVARPGDAAAKECGATSAVLSARPPHDLEALTAVIEDNRASGHTPKDVQIIVADTGVHLPEHDQWWLSWMCEPIRKLRENRYKEHEFLPWEHQPNHQHGTYVASAALGGVGYLEATRSGTSRPLRLIPWQLYRHERIPCANPQDAGTCDRFPLREDTILNAVVEADKDNAILNLSVGRQQPMTGLKDQFNPDSDVLFVVAAGNDGRDLKDHITYPAIYGGKGQGGVNLITVAALDADQRRLARFSNYSALYVDISAPGCAVPVLSYDAGEDRLKAIAASGTSFAAPLVSFTAGLIKAVLGNRSWAQVKNRLMISADLSEDGGLVGQVIDGRMLNPFKAVSVFRDVVEVRGNDGRTKLLRGHLKTGKLIGFCAGKESYSRQLTIYGPTSTTNIIKKISHLPGTSSTIADGALVYYLDGTGVLLKSDEECPPDDKTFQFVDHATGAERTLAVEEIVDIVFAEELDQIRVSDTE